MKCLDITRQLKIQFNILEYLLNSPLIWQSCATQSLIPIRINLNLTGKTQSKDKLYSNLIYKWKKGKIKYK